MARQKRSPAAEFCGGTPTERIAFSRGVLFGHDQELPFGGVPDETSINPTDGSDADLWVIDPCPAENDPTIIVVVVDERCTRRTSFERWLRHETSVPPEDAPFARIYVPESASGRHGAAQRVQAWLDRTAIEAEAVSYYPPRVW